ncbi:MAG TPA: amino acid adenylation domain-containing protein [Clostridiaceae bacterium]|nr:amino acid adenylation domain-containing protein [Clostridiaceae bacterium]
MANNNIQNAYELSHLQEGILFEKIRDKASSNYILQHVFKINGQIDTDLIEQVLELLSLKYESLRTAIYRVRKTGNYYQIILRNRKIEFNIVPILETQIDEYIERDLERGFNIELDSLVRINCWQIDKTRCYLGITADHILFDGWSMSIFLNDFQKFYKSLSSGEDFELIRSQLITDQSATGLYSNYIRFLKCVDKEDKKDSQLYWSDLTSEINVKTKIDLRHDSSGKELKTDGHYRYIVSKTIYQDLKKFSYEYHFTLNHIMESTWGLLLQYYNIFEKTCFGKIVSGRDIKLENIENSIGLYINTNPVIVEYDTDLTVVEYLNKMQEQAFNSKKHEVYPLQKILKNSSLPQGLFDTIFAYENFEKNSYDENNFLDLTTEVYCQHGATGFEFAITVNETEELILDVIYNASSYQQKDIKKIVKNYVSILDSLIDNPNGKCQDLLRADEDEARAVINLVNNNMSESVIHAFNKYVEKYPDKHAVFYDDIGLSYRDLDYQSNKVANYLIQHNYAGEAILVDCVRSLELIIAIMGILKASSAYVPIDSKSPQKRIEYIIEDSQAKIVLTNRELDYSNEGLEIKNISEILAGSDDSCILNSDSSTLRQNTLAYIIYTSGTTGQPKGSMIEHGNILRLVENVTYTTMNENTRWLQTGSIAFDASTLEIFGSLLNGGTLYLMKDSDLQNTEVLNGFIKKNKINTMFLTTSFFNQLIDLKPEIFETVDYVMTGGELVSNKHIKKYKENFPYNKIYNVYGPTECTSLATYYEIPNDYDIISIGKPIDRTQVYIMNGNHLVGFGVQGELCIAGDGVSRGYLNKDDLTAEVFQDNPFGPGKLYRTGDLACILPDGNIQIMGRIDKQVKIRGFRVEIAEIEDTINKYPGVKNSVVIAREDVNGSKSLYGYVQTDELNEAALLDFLGTQLPTYMIPSGFQQLEDIPLTINGKVDYNALPEPVIERRTEYVAPTNQIEEIICNTLEEVLEVESVGINDDFFDLGMHSLLALKVINILENQYQITLEINDIFNCTTPKTLSDQIMLSFLSAKGGQ